MIKKITLAFVLCFASFQLATAQTYFSDDFSSGNLNSWTLIDSDGDTNNWNVVNLEPIQAEHATSASWTSTTGPLTPDNWMISPAVDLTSASGNVFLQWKAYGQDQSWANENYTVYVATASDIATLSASTTTFNEIVGPTGGVYVNRNLDVTSFVGQTIYVAFRHHNVTDQFRLNIDDIVVRTVSDNDAELVSTDLPRYGLVNSDHFLNLVVNNIGGNAITSLDVTWTDGSTTNAATISTNIPGGGTATITHPDALNYATVVGNTIDITITGVNGGADSNPANNSISVMFNTMSQSGTKAVFIEEATGAWCGWCPRGTVGLNYMANTYPNTAATVAVHSGDPMEIAGYTPQIAALVGNSYPSALIDRKVLTDPGQTTLQTGYNELITEVVPVDVAAGATQAGNILTINAQATFYTNFSNANFRLAVAISEDGVTGTGDGTNAVTYDYDQVNYYSGGGSGPMGGYENLGDPVPATQMVYDHVARTILGGFDGAPNSVPAVISAGNVVSHTFNYTIPASSDVNNLHITVILIDATDGSIVNAKQSSVAQALSVEKVSGISSIKLFPNPATDKLNVVFQAGNGDYNISVTDMLGRTVINNSYQGLFGAQTIEMPVSQLNAGHYILNINDGNSSYSSKFVISK